MVTINHQCFVCTFFYYCKLELIKGINDTFWKRLLYNILEVWIQYFKEKKQQPTRDYCKMKVLFFIMTKSNIPYLTIIKH